MADAESATLEKGIGARALRREDDRYMRGRGRYVADIRRHGMLDIAVRAQSVSARAHPKNFKA